MPSGISYSAHLLHEYGNRSFKPSTLSCCPCRERSLRPRHALAKAFRRTTGPRSTEHGAHSPGDGTTMPGMVLDPWSGLRSFELDRQGYGTPGVEAGSRRLLRHGAAARAPVLRGKRISI
jgi:hypothetical protein